MYLIFFLKSLNELFKGKDYLLPISLKSIREFTKSLSLSLNYASFRAVQVVEVKCCLRYSTSLKKHIYNKNLVLAPQTLEFCNSLVPNRRYTS